MDMLSSIDLSSVVVDMASFVGVEACNLLLALLAYLLATAVFKARSTKSTSKSTPLQPRPVLKVHSQTPTFCQEASKAIREGCVGKAIDTLLQISSEGSGTTIPTILGSKMLLLLARPQQWAAVSANAVQLTGKLSTQSLESAAREAFRRGDADVCRQLRKVAGALEITKSSVFFELLAKTHSPDAGEPLRNLIDEMMEAKVFFSKSLVEAVLMACAAAKDAQLAAELLEKVELPCSDKDLSSAMIKVYVSCEQWDAAICLYEEVMLPAQVKPDPALAELLLRAANETARADLVAGLSECRSWDLGRQAKAIRAHGKDGQLASAVAIFDALKEQGKRSPNPLVYNSLLEACVQCHDMAAARKYFEEAKGLGLADVVSYNTVMKGYLLLGDCQSAHQLLEEMTERGLPPSLVTCHALLNARVQGGDLPAAWRLIDEMKAVALAPNAVTCSILLKAFVTPSHAHGLCRVMNMIESMTSPMDEVLFASLAEACIRTGRFDVLRERTRQCFEKGGLPGLTAPTYGSMIKAYGQARDVDQVWILWEEMMKRRVQPTPITVGCMVEALVMNQCCDQAWQLVQKLSSDENFKPLLNTVIYSTILKGFTMSKRTDSLMALYEEMLTIGIRCNTITYNTMLNAFAQSGDMHKVPQLLQDMKDATPPVEPDVVTYSTMVKGFCAAGDVDKGLQLLKDMKDDGKFSPDEVMFNSLLNGCARQHRLDDALRLLNDMKDAGVPPSNYTLSIMVKLLGRARRLNQALSMVQSVCAEHGFRANVQVYTCLMQACFHNRHSAKALALHDQMVDEGCLLDQKAYVALARGCLQAGAVDRAADVIRCAHHIPGHNLRRPEGQAVGVDAQCLEEVLAKLGRTTEAGKRLATEVAAAPIRQQCFHHGGAGGASRRRQSWR